jgi:hypothetical protein
MMPRMSAHHSACQFCQITSDSFRYDDDTCEECRYLDSMSRFGPTESAKRKASAELTAREVAGRNLAEV